MAPTIEPSAVKPLRRGILERLKAAKSPEEIVNLVTEFMEYKQASAKTVRRFMNLLKGVAENADETDVKAMRKLLEARGLP